MFNSANMFPKWCIMQMESSLINYLLHLQKVLDIARHLLENFDENHQSLEVEEKEHKLQQLRTVLEMFVFNAFLINHIPQIPIMQYLLLA